MSGGTQLAPGASGSTLFALGTSQLPVLERKGIFLMSKEREGGRGRDREREREDKDKNKSVGRASSRREVLLEKGVWMNYVYRRKQRVD